MLMVVGATHLVFNGDPIVNACIDTFLIPLLVFAFIRIIMQTYQRRPTP